MADEENKETAATAGNTADTRPPESSTKVVGGVSVDTQPSPATVDVNSPFFGKISPQSKPVPLNQSSSQTSPLSRAEDKLLGGNVVSLLEAQERAKSTTPTPVRSGTKYTESPVQRSIREIGLKPRVVQEKKETPPSDALATKPGELPRIRTYAADMSEEIKRRGETLSTIISAERMKMGKGPVGDETSVKTEVSAQEKNRGVLLSFAAIGLLFFGCVALAIAFLVTREQPVAPQRMAMIPINYSELVAIQSEKPTIDVLAELRQDTDLRLGEMKEFILTEFGVPLQGSEVLTLFGAPNLLARNSTNVLVGIHAFDRNQPFILVSVSAYDLAFEGMLQWEDTLAESLGGFFAPYKSARDTQTAKPPRMTFSDRVYQNIDVRESGAEWKILYAFPRRDLLLITTNESTLREVITRLTLQSGN